MIRLPPPPSLFPYTTLFRSSGDDIFYVDHAGDVVIEAAGGGSDTLIANVSFTLGAGQEVETLRTFGSGTTDEVNLTGNTLAQTILGNAAANDRRGGGGADVLRGYGGHDTYYVDDSSDSVIEADGGGSDTVIAAVSYTLGVGQAVETLRTYGSGTTDVVNLTGNTLVNTILGNAAENVLDGKGGADMLRGYGGGDTYYLDTDGDSVI